jgi:hypothetical protein
MFLHPVIHGWSQHESGQVNKHVSLHDMAFIVHTPHLVGEGLTLTPFDPFIRIRGALKIPDKIFLFDVLSFQRNLSSRCCLSDDILFEMLPFR